MLLNLQVPLTTIDDTITNRITSKSEHTETYQYQNQNVYTNTNYLSSSKHESEVFEV